MARITQTWKPQRPIRKLPRKLVDSIRPSVADTDSLSALSDSFRRLLGLALGSLFSIGFFCCPSSGVFFLFCCERRLRWCLFAVISWWIRGISRNAVVDVLETF